MRGGPPQGGVGPRTQDWRLFRARQIALEERCRKRAGSVLDVPLYGETAPPKVGGKRRTDLWAHRIAHPEQGCILVSSKSSGSDGRPLGGTAVLLTECDKRVGARGLILNKPAGVELGSYFAGTRLVDSLPAEASLRQVHLGGPAGVSNITALTSKPGAEGKEVLNGVWETSPQVS